MSTAILSLPVCIVQTTIHVDQRPGMYWSPIPTTIALYRILANMRRPTGVCLILGQRRKHTPASNKHRPRDVITSRVLHRKHCCADMAIPPMHHSHSNNVVSMLGGIWLSVIFPVYHASYIWMLTCRDRARRYVSGVHLSALLSIDVFCETQ